MSSTGRRFEGQVALITGGSRGIGLAIARRIVAEGGRVCLTGRKPDGLSRAVEQLGGPRVALSVTGPADSPAHQDEAIQRVLDQFGRLDLLVNNAAVNPAFGRLLATDPGALRKIFEVNVYAALSWVEKAHPALSRSPGAAVVSVASVAGLRPAQDIGAYGASKAALTYLTQQLAVELAPTIRVNAVAPAVVRTSFAGPLIDGREAQVVQRYPLGRVGTPEDVAGAVAFLASADAAWITGQVLVIDGGLTLSGGV